MCRFPKCCNECVALTSVEMSAATMSIAMSVATMSVVMSAVNRDECCNEF